MSSLWDGLEYRRVISIRPRDVEMFLAIFDA